MKQTWEAIAQILAERLCWQVARRDDARMVRRLYRKQVVDGVYQLDEAALLVDFFYVLQELGVGDWLSDVRGTGIQREMVPVVQYLLLFSLKTLFGIERMRALPALLFSDEALRRLVGVKAKQVRQGGCPQGVARRQGPRTGVPICPDILAENLVKLHLCDLETLVIGVIRALVRAQVFASQVTGIVDATDLETTAWTERWETGGIGIVGLTTYDRYGPPRMGVTTVGTCNRSGPRERLEASSHRPKARCCRYHSTVRCKPSRKSVRARNPNACVARVVSRQRRGWPSGFVVSHTRRP
jgi:hypothetical protein